MSVEVKVPSVGESVTEVYIGVWHKAVGEQVKQDEDLVELESEKATFDAPAPVAGTLEKILKQPGESAAIGEVIAYIDDSKNGRGSEKAARAPEQQQTTSKVPTETQSREKTEPRVPKAAPSGESRAESMPTPAARRLLKEHGLAAEDVKATGPHGRLLKEDVLREIDSPTGEHGKTSESSAIAVRKSAETPTDSDVVLPPGDEIVPMSPLRRRIARRLVKAQQEAALLTTFNEVDMSSVISMRTLYQEDFQKKYGIKLGFMSFFVKAAVGALMEIPELNAEVRGTDIVYHSRFDIGVAVSTEQGLVVPIVRDAERLSFAEVEQKLNELAAKARSGKLSVEDLVGGTFTVTNGGVFGSLMSTPIVNPPQSGVLGMHAIQDRPVVRNGQIVVRPMMYLALTYDHRLVDGREAVTFLKRIKETIEEPARLLIEV